MSVSKLFEPIKIGNAALKHRVVMAPLTRFRANDAHVPSLLAPEYYSQRASTEGTLIVTEATFIAAKAGGFHNIPGIWNADQITGWKKVTDAVHSKGSFIFLQIWSVGRAAEPEQLKDEDPSFSYVSASPIKLTGRKDTPRAMTVPEIKEFVQFFATAASNAVEAGFDGVEIHAVNGFLVDQFIQDVSNQRDDEYGGSVENRARFLLEIIDAVVKTIGVNRTGVRLSPWNKFQDMGMKDPVPQFSYIVQHIRDRYPGFAYIHLVEPRVDGWIDRDDIPKGQSNDFIRKIASPIPIISAGGYTPQSGQTAADKTGDLIAYGRAFIANPDLPLRIKNGIPLTKGDRETYFVPGSLDPKGYIDYPFASEEDIQIQAHL